METITKELTIDLYGPTMRYAVEAHQGDRATRVLLITVTEDGQPFKLPVGADYIAQIKKPNRVTVYKKCTMQNNVITLTLPGNALDERGRATCRTLGGCYSRSMLLRVETTRNWFARISEC